MNRLLCAKKRRILVAILLLLLLLLLLLSSILLLPLFNYHSVLISVPSQAPSELTLSATSSASITASWQLPPAYSRHGIIVGFKLFYKKKGLGSMRVETINGGTTFAAGINGLDNYTEYEFQVLAFTSHGDGPKSFVVVERTLEDGKKFDCLWQWHFHSYWFSRAFHIVKVGLT